MQSRESEQREQQRWPSLSAPAPAPTSPFLTRAGSPAPAAVAFSPSKASAAPGSAPESVAVAATTVANAANVMDLPDLEFTIHELQLDATPLRQIQQERRPHVWVSVDPLGLADELGCTTCARGAPAPSTRQSASRCTLGCLLSHPSQSGGRSWRRCALRRSRTVTCTSLSGLPNRPSTFMGLTRAITTRRMAQKSALLTSTSRSFTASSTSSAASDCQWWQRAAPFSATSSSACAALRRCGSPRRASPPMGQRGSGWMCAWRM